MSAQHKKVHPAAVEGDFYGIKSLLPADERATPEKVRTFLADRVAPTANDLWARAESPLHLVGALRDLGITGVPGDAPEVTRRSPPRRRLLGAGW